MAFSEDLLNRFILALEHTKIPVGGDVAIRLQHIFNLQGIDTAEKLAAQKFLIGPVVARSPEEQQRFYSAFDQFIAAAGVVKHTVVTRVNREIKKNERKARRGAIVFSALIIGVIIYLVWPARLPDPAVNFAWTDSSITAHEEIVFKNLSDTFHNYSRFDWNYGDGITTSAARNDSTPRHIYNAAGDYKVTLTARIDTAGFLNHIDTTKLNISKVVHVKPDTVCRIKALFYSRNDAADKRSVTFTNASTGRECTEGYSWSFGDNISDVAWEGSASPVAHLYPNAATYHVRLTAFGHGDTAIYEQTIQTDEQPTFISLAPFDPLLIHADAPVIEKEKKSLRLIIACCILLVLLPFIFAYTRFLLRRKNLTRIFKKEYEVNDNPVAPYTYQLPDERLAVQSERELGELAFRLRHPEQGDAVRLDIFSTIAGTIRNAGFPKLLFNETQTTPSYVALVDLDSGVSQQVHLFGELLQTLEMYRVNFTVFYFRGSMQVCFNTAYPDGISIEKITELYESSRLIVYTNGASLLHDNSSTGFVSWAPKLFNRWKNKAIITPVPRYNWDENERQLNKLFPIYPAGLSGHLVMAKAFIKGRHRLFVRKKAMQWLSPFPADVELYREYFLREDPKLFMWLLALAVPEKTGWNTTMLVGKIVEDQLCVMGERLVTYENLLRLTSVEWLQNGLLTPHHRMELYAELKKQEGAEELIKAINTEMLRGLEKFVPPLNSAAALEKKIQLALLNYQLREDKKAAEHELHYLAQAGLLNRFAKNVIYKTKEGFTKFNPRKAILTASVGVLLLGALLFPGVRTAVAARVPGPALNDTIAMDTAAFLNNLAAKQMQNTPPGIDDTITVPAVLKSALDIEQNDTITANILTYRFRKGINLYRDRKFLQAALLFDFSNLPYSFSSDDNIADSATQKFEEIISAQPVLQSDSFAQVLRAVAKGIADTSLYKDFPVNTRPGQALLYAKHAQGVCCYYISQQMDDIEFLAVAKQIDSMLLKDDFYEFYPDKAGNLNRLLFNNMHPQDTVKYMLEVIPAINKNHPLITVTDDKNKIVISKKDKVIKELPEGDYTITVAYAEQPAVIELHLDQDTKIAVPPVEYPVKLNVNARDANGKPASVWKMELYDEEIRQFVYSDTLSSFSGKYSRHKYELRVIFSSDESQLITRDFYLRKDTTITITEPQYQKKAIHVHIDDVSGKPASNILETNTDDGTVYGRSDVDGNLTFYIDPAKIGDIKLRLSNGAYEQYVVITKEEWEKSDDIRVTLNDYTGFTLIFFPADLDGNRSGMKSAGGYQRSILKVMQATYPNDKFVLIEDFSDANEKIVSRYNGALAAMTIQLRVVVPDQGNFMTFITTTSVANQKAAPVSFQFRSPENNFELYEQNLKKVLPQVKGRWSVQF